MTTPAPMPSKNNPRVGFSNLVDRAIRARPAETKTAAHALGIGVDPQVLIEYARGRCSAEIRSQAEMMVLDSPWAHSRVVALIRSAREPSSLGAGILRTEGRTKPHEWGISKTEDPDMDLARLLDEVR